MNRFSDISVGLTNFLKYILLSLSPRRISANPSPASTPVEYQNFGFYDVQLQVSQGNDIFIKSEGIEIF